MYLLISLFIAIFFMAVGFICCLLLLKGKMRKQFQGGYKVCDGCKYYAAYEEPPEKEIEEEEEEDLKAMIAVKTRLDQIKVV